MQPVHQRADKTSVRLREEATATAWSFWTRDVRRLFTLPVSGGKDRDGIFKEDYVGGRSPTASIKHYGE